MDLQLLLRIFVPIVCQCFLVSALLLNRTIDDTNGDVVMETMPIYSPLGDWNDASCSPSDCYVLPPTAPAFDQTYHAATYIGDGARTVQLSFTANNVPNAWTETLCDFILDGSASGSFQHTPTTSSDFQYRALVYSVTGLDNTGHTLLISADGYDTYSYVNFDYALYTYDDGVDSGTTTSNSSPEPTASSETVPPPTVTTIITSLTSLTTTATSVYNKSESKSSAPASSDNTVFNASIAPTMTETPTSQDRPSSNMPVIGSNGNIDTVHAIPIGMIVGCVVGGFALFLIILLLFLCRGRWQTRLALSKSGPDAKPPLTPFTLLSPSGIPHGGRHGVVFKEPTLLVIDPYTGKPQEDYVPENMPSASGSTTPRSAALGLEHRNMMNEKLKRPMKGMYDDILVSRWQGMDMTEIVEENRRMEEEIKRLHEQLGSDWALGHFADGFSYSKGKLEEAFRAGGILEKAPARAAKDPAIAALKKEDVDLIVNELEIPRPEAEKALLENGGDLVKTLYALVDS
ncbi:hypothetical protein H0H92_002986 [Tricholoma furcatifolium]|nr:hypothetical protein H0H92_002986 [Tricholoma furcatifolium]